MPVLTALGHQLFPAVHDPGHTILRRAARVAVVLPLSYGLAVLFDLEGGAVFAAFGVFALMVFADFGGPPWPRARAYLITGAIGVPTIALGTLVSASIPVAVVATFLVGFSVVMSSSLRGYIAAAGPALQLAFVVAVSFRAPLDTIPQLVIGWLVAVALVVPASVLLWPGRRRSALRAQAAVVCRSVAALLRLRWSPQDTSGAPMAAATAELIAGVDKLDTVYGGKPFRPAGATARDRALMMLVEELRRITMFMSWISGDPRDGRPGQANTPGNRELAEATATALERAAAAVVGEGPVPDAAELDRERIAHRVATESWVADGLLHPGSGAREAVFEGVERAYPLRMVSLLTALIANDVAVSQGHPAVQLEGNPELGVTSWRQSLAEQFSIESPWFRNALRSGMGLGIALLIALISGVEHGFWIVLGVLGVLRFDILGTGRSALQAIWGTLLGFVVGTGLMLVVGDSTVLLWILLPITAFLAGWAPAATTFPLGQASFTIFVLVLFGLIAYPPEFATGVVRVQDILIGVLVSLVVGVCMWPHGVAGQLRGTLAAAFEAAAAHLRTSIEILGGVTDPAALEPLSQASAAAVARAEEAFDLALMQRGTGIRRIEDWTRLTATVSHIRTCAVLLTEMWRLGLRPTGCPGSGAVLASAGDQVSDRMAGIAVALRQRRSSIDAVHDPGSGAVPGGGGQQSAAAPPTDRSQKFPHMRHCAFTCMARAAQSPAPPTGGPLADATGARARSVVAMVWAHDWLVHLDWLATRSLPRAEDLATPSLGTTEPVVRRRAVRPGRANRKGQHQGG